MDTILGIPPDGSYSGIRALADLSICVNLYQHLRLLHVGAHAALFFMHVRAHRGRSVPAPVPTPATHAPSAPAPMHGAQQLQTGSCD
jgi:hypothetical protein